ncbi:uncharacterized protein N7515_008951 [Penicillium bovifimosum]|uniref:MARVEL domain-containing protein n=1 Tax=Penicillium bovifimosum TaxID=126998 RepID=A0A9W9GIC9_9EURO|nr:uncharacterized protein N7515_008951 [Penicillium bovifimosum]KAJ5120990.1 hypothetical protein N7515_008951 [Penicillium bovifimosum]
MLALNIILYALLGTSLVFAIVELGLSAYVTSISSGTVSNGYYYYDVDPPAIVIFLVFSSVWTILVTIAALVLPWHYGRKGLVSAKLNTVLAAIFVAVYFVTMVFWLACFADLANIVSGYTNIDPYYSAVLAFGVLLWLLFLALVVLTILAMCGVLVSDWAGYHSLRKNKEVGATQTAGPAQDVQMSMPTVVPSDLSSSDAKALHNQPNTQSFSPSEPSPIHSAELSGNSVHHDHRTGPLEISPV